MYFSREGASTLPKHLADVSDLSRAANRLPANRTVSNEITNAKHMSRRKSFLLPVPSFISTTSVKMGVSRCFLAPGDAAHTTDDDHDRVDPGAIGGLPWSRD
jgi:hypothetical protein